MCDSELDCFAMIWGTTGGTWMRSEDEIVVMYQLISWFYACTVSTEENVSVGVAFQVFEEMGPDLLAIYGSGKKVFLLDLSLFYKFEIV